MTTTTVYKIKPETKEALKYLDMARQHHSLSYIANHLNIDPRTIRRWQVKETEPKPYVVHALKRVSRKRWIFFNQVEVIRKGSFPVVVFEFFHSRDIAQHFDPIVLRHL